MNTSTQNAGRKRTTLIVALVACLVLAVGAGVFAWFSAQDTKTNTFVAGDGITEPDKKPDPGKPEGGGDGGDENVDENDHYIIETEWVDNSPIVPNSFVPKNPNVGIGEKSKPAYVFVDVKNNLGADTYFVLGANWEPVANKAEKYSDATFDASINKDRCYTSGLFVYVGSDPSTTAALLTPSGNGKDVYTGEVFDRVYTNADFEKLAESKTIEVKAFLAAATDEGDQLNTKFDEIQNEAIKWAGRQ